MYDDLMNTSGTSFLERRDAHSLNVLGRLRAGTSLAQARAGLAVASDGLAGQYPATNKEVRLLMVPETSARPTPNIGPMFRIVATVLAGLAALLLVITSLNVANLLVARAATRGREVALRSALGAQRGRLVRQFVTESLVLALMGTALAIPVVVLAMRGLEQSFTQMTSAATVRPDFSLDVRVLAAALAVATLSGIISGLAPTVFAFRGDLNALLKTGGRGAPAPVRNRLRGALVVAQVAVSLALLVSGGLFARSLQNARHIDLGFQSDGILLASTAPGLQGYSPAQRLAFYRNVGARVAEIPGVERAAWISWPPFATVYQNTILSPEGQAQDSDVQGRMAYIAHISPDYLSTVRIPVIEGRMFDERDDGTAARVAIVNETLAKRFWPGQNATGRQLSLGNETVNVVGVVRDGKYVFLWEAPSAMVFRPLTQDVPTAATIAVRTTRLPLEIASDVRQAIRNVDPDVATYDVRTMDDHLESGSNGFAIFRLAALAAGLFGGMGVLLASIGLYGMMAYHVSQRTHEIGVRMALGARGGDIIRDVLTYGGRVALLGIVIGVLLAASLAQLLRRLLLDVSPLDPFTYTAVALLVIAITVLASFVPARRATIVDPMVALRTD
jgi:predicted permease